MYRVDGYGQGLKEYNWFMSTEGCNRSGFAGYAGLYVGVYIRV